MLFFFVFNIQKNETSSPPTIIPSLKKQNSTKFKGLIGFLKLLMNQAASLLAPGRALLGGVQNGEFL